MVLFTTTQSVLNFFLSPNTHQDNSPCHDIIGIDIYI